MQLSYIRCSVQVNLDTAVLPPNRNATHNSLNKYSCEYPSAPCFGNAKKRNGSIYCCRCTLQLASCQRNARPAKNKNLL